MGIYDRVEAIRFNIQNRERWYGMKESANEIHAIDNTFTPFRVISGDSDFGECICVIGSQDIPIIGHLTFVLHRIVIKATEKPEVYKIRLLWGSGTSEEAFEAGTFSDILFNTSVFTGKSTSMEVRIHVIEVGMKVWACSWSETNNNWLDFFVGVHANECEE